MPVNIPQRTAVSSPGSAPSPTLRRPEQSQLGAVSQVLDKAVGAYVDVRNKNDLSNATISYKKTVLELEDKYKNDENLANLNERFQAELEERTEGIVSNVGQGVQTQLSQDLNFRNIDAIARVKNMTFKREGEQRQAFFEQNIDGMVNGIVLANTDKDRITAQSDLDGALESVRPYYAPDKFAKLEDSITDKTKFYTVSRAIPGMVRSGKKLDLGMISDLDIAYVQQLEGQYNQEIGKNDAIAKSLYKDSKNSLLSITETGEEGGDLEGELRNLGTPEAIQLAEEYKLKKFSAHKAFDVMQGIKTSSQSFEDMESAVELLYTVRPGESNISEKISTRNRLLEAVSAQRQEFKKDQFTYVQDIVGGMEGVDNETAIDANILVQRRLGKGMSKFKPQVMPTEQLAQLQDQYTGASLDGKAQMIGEVAQSFGKYATPLLSSMGVNGGSMVAAEAIKNPQAARNAKLWVSASNTKVQDIPIDADTKTTVRSNIESELQDNDVYSAFSNLKKLFPYDSAMNKAHDDVLETTRKIGYLLEDSEKAVGELNAVYNAVSDEDIGYVYFSSQYSVDAVEQGLEGAKSFNTLFKMSSPEKLGLNESEYRQFIDNINENSLWVPSEGDTVTLVDTSGRTILFDGKPYTMSIEEVVAERVSKIREVDTPIGLR